MKSTLIILVFAAFAAASKEDGKIDNMNVEQILTDEKLFQQYFNCVMDKGKCTPGGEELKEGIVEHVKVGCAGCTKKRLDAASKLVNFMIQMRGPQFQEIEKKYDPKQTLRKQFAS